MLRLLIQLKTALYLQLYSFHSASWSFWRFQKIANFWVILLFWVNCLCFIKLQIMYGYEWLRIRLNIFSALELVVKKTLHRVFHTMNLSYPEPLYSNYSLTTPLPCIDVVLLVVSWATARSIIKESYTKYLHGVEWVKRRGGGGTKDMLRLLLLLSSIVQLEIKSKP